MMPKTIEKELSYHISYMCKLILKYIKLTLTMNVKNHKCIEIQ